MLATELDLMICDIAMELMDEIKVIETVQARGFKGKDRLLTIFLTLIYRTRFGD